jgi:TPR repeat protein
MFYRILVIAICLLSGIAAFAGAEETPQAIFDRADALTKDWKLGEAVAVLQPLAAQGNAEAQFKVGRLYDIDGAMFQIKGKGAQLGAPEDDFAQAENWYQKATDQGYLRAEAYLGKLYIWGIGGTRSVGADPDRGMKILLIAAKAGNREAQCYLGVNYEQGVGVAIDEAEAIKWYRLAAEQGDEYAASDLGYRYATGKGVPKDPLEAYVWLMIAGEDKTGPGKQLTMEQVEEGDRRVEALRAKFPK